MNKGFKIVWILVVAFFAALLLLSAFSCQVLKGKREVRSDSTVVNKSDSGSLKVNSTERRDSSVYWRDIIDLIHKDTVINNVPITNYYPTRIIREGGTQVSREQRINYDSLWYHRLDSLNRSRFEESKSKETKVLTQFQIWAVIGLLGLFVIKNLLK